MTIQLDVSPPHLVSDLFIFHHLFQSHLAQSNFPRFNHFPKRLFLHRQPQWDEAFHKGWPSQMLSCEFFCFEEAIKRPLPVKARKILVCQIQRFYGWIPPIKTAEVPEEKSSQDFPRRLCCCCGVCSGSNIADGSTVDGPNYGHW